MSRRGRHDLRHEGLPGSATAVRYIMTRAGRLPTVTSSARDERRRRHRPLLGRARSRERREGDRRTTMSIENDGRGKNEAEKPIANCAAAGTCLPQQRLAPLREKLRRGSSRKRRRVLKKRVIAHGKLEGKRRHADRTETTTETKVRSLPGRPTEEGTDVLKRTIVLCTCSMVETIARSPALRRRSARCWVVDEWTLSSRDRTAREKKVTGAK